MFIIVPTNSLMSSTQKVRTLFGSVTDKYRNVLMHRLGYCRVNVCFMRFFLCLQTTTKPITMGHTVQIEWTVNIFRALSLCHTFPWKAIINIIVARHSTRHSQYHIRHCHDGDGIYNVSVDVNSCLRFLFSHFISFDVLQSIRLVSVCFVYSRFLVRVMHSGWFGFSLVCSIFWIAICTCIVCATGRRAYWKIAAIYLVFVYQNQKSFLFFFCFECFIRTNRINRGEKI